MATRFVRLCSGMVLGAALLCAIATATVTTAGAAPAASAPCPTTYPAVSCPPPTVVTPGQSPGTQAPPAQPAANAPGGGGALSFTGFPLLIWVAVGAALVLAGTVTVRLARRRHV